MPSFVPFRLPSGLQLRMARYGRVGKEAVSMKRTVIALAILMAFSAAAQAAGAFGSPVSVRKDAGPNIQAPSNGGGVVPQQIVVPSASAPSIVQVPPLVQNVQAQLARITAQQATGAEVVTLTWHEHETYPIPIKVGMFTTIAFPKDEPVQQFAVSNPKAVELQVNAQANVAMLMLKQPVTVVATVVTTKHIYYLNIEPSAGAWYQGVNWAFDTEQGFGASTFGGGLYQAATPTPSQGVPNAAPDNALFTGQPNFDYTISGTAPFKPVAVWDNGRFTWVQFANNIQELPALFAKGPNGLEIVNYTIHNHNTQILVNRLMSQFVLKLGKSVITVTAGH